MITQNNCKKNTYTVKKKKNDCNSLFFIKVYFDIKITKRKTVKKK